MAEPFSLDPEILRQVLEAIPDLVFLLDEEGRVLYANRNELGIGVEEALGHSIFRFVAPGFEEAYREVLAQVLDTGEAAEHEGAALGADGLPRWYRSRIVPIRTQRGSTLLVSVAQDVTDRRKAEDARRRSDAILQAVAAVAHLFLGHHSWEEVIDQALARLGEATEVSRSYFFQTHPGPDDSTLLSQRFEWAAPDVEPQIDNPDMQNLDLEATGHGRWLQHFQAGQIVHGPVSTFPESERPHLQGQSIRSLAAVPVFVRGEWWGSLGFDDCRVAREWSNSEREALQAAAGTLGGAIEREQAEAGIRASERHYRRLVQTSPYTVYALDDQGRMTELNRAGEELLGRRAADVLGDPFARFFAPEDLPAAEAAYHRLLSGQVPEVEVELKVQRPSGDRRYIHLAATPIRQGDAIVGAHGIARDITEDRIQEEHLRRAKRLASLGTLVGGVAHELNNPLTAIQGMVQLLLDETRSEDEEEMLRTIFREAERSARIVGNLRLLTRKSHSPAGSTQEVDLSDIVHHVLQVRRYAMETHNIQVNLELSDSLPPLAGDSGQLEQVVLNLVVNAEQALAKVERAGRIVIGTKASQDGATLWVQDDGPGIHPEYLDRIFDPFWTTKDPDEGTGLGLSLVHGILADHGGTVEVESEPGEGARFMIHLPGARAAPVATAAQPPTLVPPEPQLPGRPLRVLVVDDEPGIRQVLLRLLARDGHAVVLAEDGGEALQKARTAKEAFDLVLTDLRMPGVGGEELHSRLLDADPVYEERVVFMTGDVTTLEARARNNDDQTPMIRKPFDLSEIQSLLLRYGQRKD
jgi:PAS domain S-box-containing protein